MINKIKQSIDAVKEVFNETQTKKNQPEIIVDEKLIITQEAKELISNLFYEDPNQSLNIWSIIQLVLLVLIFILNLLMFIKK